MGPVRFHELHRTPLLLAVLLSGCPTNPPSDEETGDPGPLPLADNEAWVRVTDPTQDAFADQRPVDAVCDDAGYFLDPITQTFEVQTEVCDYPTFRQPTLEPLAPGDVVTVFALHGVLTAPELAQGYLGLAFDGEIEWEHEVAIPSDAAVIEETFTIDRSIPVGTEMQFHVHNHGPNTWELSAVLVTPAE
jgi:hypothetical protein